MPQLTQLLDRLEAHYGPQSPGWPTDPYLFLVWWHCGYPAGDASCAKGWESLKTRIGLEPDRLLAAHPSRLALCLKPGGMVPEIRAGRLKEIAERVQKEFGGDLTAALKRLPPLRRARRSGNSRISPIRGPTERSQRLDARIRAYLLLKCHGQKTCKRSNPKCGTCPVAASCAFHTPGSDVKAV